MNEDIHEAINNLRSGLRWSKRFRMLSALLFLAPLVGYPLFMIFVSMTDQGPERGMILLPLIYYGLFASPLLLLPLIAWIVFGRRCRILEERLSMLPSVPNEHQIA